MAAYAAPVARPADKDRVVLLHLRTTNDRILHALEIGYRGSALFRDLVEEIESANTFVYLDGGACASKAPACLTFMGASSGVLYLHLRVETFQPMAPLLGLLAHELVHVHEAICDGNVRSEADMEKLFSNMGWRRAAGSYETEEAEQIEQQVRMDVAGRR